MQYLFRWLVQYLVFMFTSLMVAGMTAGLFAVGCYVMYLGGIQTNHWAWLGLKIMSIVIFIVSYFVLRELTQSLYAGYDAMWAWVDKAKRR